jgi:ketosteroid isomerase-like protein
MTDEQTIIDTMRDFARVLTKGDTKKAISFFTEDAVWDTPNGTFSGIEGITKYIEWMKSNITDQTITETGIGISVKANTGIYEHIIGGITKGRKWDASAICIYEFQGKKIKSIRMVYDRLKVAHQVTTGIAKTAVGNIVREMEKGLH